MKRTSTRRSLTKSGSAPELYEAVLFGALEDLKRAVRTGSKINVSSSDGFTPIMAAAQRGDPDVAAYLLSEGAKVDHRNDIGQTALMIAAKSGHKAVAQELIMAGADVRAVDNEKRNAIAWATVEGDFPDVIGLLVASGADYDARDVRGITPLMRAALLGRIGTVALLLSVGANHTVKWRGKTAYVMAHEKGQEKVCDRIRTVLRNRPKDHRL